MLDNDRQQGNQAIRLAGWGLLVVVALAVAAGRRQPSELGASQPSTQTVESGKVLYGRYCLSCHGETGNGQGVAARYLFPKPRDFRRGRFRLVSSVNRIARREDIARVIENGIPGSSMPGFSRLQPAERKLLTDTVLQLWRDGRRDAISAHLQENEDEVDPALVKSLGTRQTTATELLEIPAWQEATAETLARGKVIYEKQNCRACHGSDGRGNLGQDLFDDSRRPTRARDLVWDELKSGADASDIYRRIRLGIPGTPMPSSRNLSPGELQDLVHYCLSLGEQPKRKLTNHQRARLAIGVPLRSVQPPKQ